MEHKPIDGLTFLYIQRLGLALDGGSGWRDEGAQVVMRDRALTLECARKRMGELAGRAGGAWRIIDWDGNVLAEVAVIAGGAR